MKTQAGFGTLFRSTLCVLSASCWLVLAASCSDSATQPVDTSDASQDLGGNDAQGDQRVPDESPQDLVTPDQLKDGTTPGGLLLEFALPYGDDNAKCQGYSDPPENSQKITTCTFNMGHNQQREFKVVVFNDGAPVQDQQVTWTVEDVDATPPDSAALVLESATSVTDADGFASVLVTSNMLSGSALLVASLEGIEGAPEALHFRIEVPQESPTLTVLLEYDGPRDFETVNVHLFLQEEGEPACAGLKPWDLPGPANKSGSVGDVSLPVRFLTFPELTPENPMAHFTVVAVAQDPDVTFGMAMGCNDMEAVVELGKATTVVVPLLDVAPEYTGTYQVVTYLDLLSVLPGELEEYLNLVVDFLSSPTSGLLVLTCVVDSPALQSLCAAMFQNPQEPSTNALTEVGTAVHLVVDTFTKGLITAALGNDILFSAADFANVLNLQVYSEITISAEPDASGTVPAAAAGHEWQTIQVQWTLGQDCSPADPQCGLKTIALAGSGQQGLSGQIEFRVPGYADGTFDVVELGEHKLGFQVGSFLNALVQTVILPGVAGDGTLGWPVVDTYGKFVQASLGGGDCLAQDNCCQVFVQQVLQHTSADVQTVLAEGCEALIVMAPAFFEDWFLHLDSDTPPSTVLASNPSAECQVFDLNGDYVPDQFGSEANEAKRCRWSVTLDVGGKSVEAEASFWAKKVE